MRMAVSERNNRPLEIKLNVAYYQLNRSTVRITPIVEQETRELFMRRRIKLYYRSYCVVTIIVHDGQSIVTLK